MSETLPRLRLVTRFQESATTCARRTRRNGQRMALYAERCLEIAHDLDQSIRLERSTIDAEYVQDLMAVSRLEVIMLKLHPILVEEAGYSSPTPESCESWERNRRTLEGALHELYRDPFRAPPEPWGEELDNATKFDEWTWVTRLIDTLNASSSSQLEKYRALVQDIRNLESEYWASDQDTRASTMAAITDVFNAIWKDENSTTATPSSTSQRTNRLDREVNLPRRSEPITYSSQPSGSSPGLSLNRADGSYYRLNQLQLERVIDFIEASFSEGPRHNQTWSSVITLTRPIAGVFVGHAREKQEARASAALQALQYFYDKA